MDEDKERQEAYSQTFEAKVQELGDQLRKLMDSILETLHPVVRWIKKIIDKFMEVFFKCLAKVSGKPGQIYLKTKSKRIKRKQQKKMVQKWMQWSEHINSPNETSQLKEE